MSSPVFSVIQLLIIKHTFVDSLTQQTENIRNASFMHCIYQVKNCDLIFSVVLYVASGIIKLLIHQT
jgi:hypothetical protein